MLTVDPSIPLALVGMSGVGKSYQARVLATQGWCHLDCDARIADRLSDLVSVGASESAVHALGRWMGMPWQPDFLARQARYLALEELVTHECIEEALHLNSQGKSVVLDTTGSVVYLSSGLQQTLQDMFDVLYLEVPARSMSVMLERYLGEPKPLVWGDHWPQGAEESCLGEHYASLLAWRADRYAGLASRNMPAWVKNS